MVVCTLRLGKWRLSRGDSARAALSKQEGRAVSLGGLPWRLVPSAAWPAVSPQARCEEGFPRAASVAPQDSRVSAVILVVSMVLQGPQGLVRGHTATSGRAGTGALVCLVSLPCPQ